jgi:hypothetical protein
MHKIQNNPHVLFLCQTIEGVENKPIRKNHISDGKSIFMPIINWISILGEAGNTDQELIETAKERMDVVGKLELIINDNKVDKGLEKYRIRSPFFYIHVPDNKHIWNRIRYKACCISDGYWIFFHPNYENPRISTFSYCSSGITHQSTIPTEYKVKPLRIIIQYIYNTNHFFKNQYKEWFFIHLISKTFSIWP